MSIVTFTVYNPQTGEILRSGTCEEADAPRQAFGPDEQVCIGTRGHDVTDRMVIPANGGKPYPRRRSAAECAARSRNPVEPVDPMAVIAEALRLKAGITLTTDDLAAAAKSVQARRKPDA